MDARRAVTRRHVVIVGAGGNIGSHLVPHIARMPVVGRITLIDPDRYERRNLESQAIGWKDVGRRKVDVQADRIRMIARDRVRVRAAAERVEEVPIGWLMADVIVACLDSRAARQAVNESARRLGVPWIDAGVEPTQSLMRVNVYSPSGNAPCLECAWSEADYAALETIHPCDAWAEAARNIETPPTNAPSSLGALAAAWQAVECAKVLSGDVEGALVGRQLLIDCTRHRHFVSTYRRNGSCRLVPHHAVDLVRLRSGSHHWRLDRLLRRARRDGVRAAATLTVTGRRYLPQLSTFVSPLRFARGAWGGFHAAAAMNIDGLPPRLLTRSLRQLGIRGGDVVTIANGAHERHYVVADDTW